MKDYSLLFNQGLFSIAAERTIVVRRPVPRIPRHVNGRSFLNLKTSVYTDEESFRHPFNTPMTSTGVSFSFTTKSIPTQTSESFAKSSPPGSPTRRALPLPKPAPLSSLPAIPAGVPVPPSPIPSSALISSSSFSRKHRKHSSLSPSFFSARTHASEAENSVHTVSSAYRKRRRQDALHALEGKRRSQGRSFMPSIMQEDDEESVSFAAPPALLANVRSHLSFGSTAVYPVIRTPNSDSSNQAVFSARPSLLLSPPTPCFSISYASEPITEPPNVPRRASTTGVSTNHDWGMNFIDLEDDSGSSLWRWSHVA